MRSSKIYPSLPTVKFDPSSVTDHIKNDLRDNVESLDDVATPDKPILYEAALRAVLAGSDNHSLSKLLINLGLTKRRAAEISCYLSNNATILIEAERRKELGIKCAIWRYGGVPCGDYDTDKAHREADGKRFPVTDGLCINGKLMLPGRDWGCHCTSRAVIPGFNEDADQEEQVRADEKNDPPQTVRHRKIFPFMSLLRNKFKN